MRSEESRTACTCKALTWSRHVDESCWRSHTSRPLAKLFDQAGACTQLSNHSRQEDMPWWDHQAMVGRQQTQACMCSEFWEGLMPITACHHQQAVTGQGVRQMLQVGSLSALCHTAPCGGHATRAAAAHRSPSRPCQSGQWAAGLEGQRSPSHIGRTGFSAQASSLAAAQDTLHLSIQVHSRSSAQPPHMLRMSPDKYTREQSSESLHRHQRWGTLSALEHSLPKASAAKGFSCLAVYGQAHPRALQHLHVSLNTVPHQAGSSHVNGPTVQRSPVYYWS